MPLNAAIVGRTCEPVECQIDSRWLMAYASGLSECGPCYFDTRRAGGVLPHPMFPVSYEWPAILGIFRNLRDSGITPDEAARGVHATHDLTVHRAVRAGDRLITSATIATVEQRKPGAYLVSRLETKDAAGLPVTTTLYGTLYRGVSVNGPSRPAEERRPETDLTAARPLSETRITIPATAAHVYTECARIWNPIHTDSAVAERASLPAIILHGSATLAYSISEIARSETGENPNAIRSIKARFGAMVLMPSEIVVRILRREKTNGGTEIAFETLTSDGAPAIRDGRVGILQP